MRKTLFFFTITLIACTLLACGGSSGGGISGEPQKPSISISPMNPNILVGQTQVFRANIQNLSDTRVAWSVQEENGGTIASTDAGGVYTAPWPTGMYHVVATALADSSVTTNTMVSVTAKFVFMEEVPGGDAVPYSMTPMLGTLGADGKFGIAGITDSSTGTPVVAALGSIVLSPDGTKAAFDMITPDWQSTDVYIANVDTTNVTQLTTDGSSFWPQFSPDGQLILYIKGSDIWVMNADGSNQHVVFSAPVNNAAVWSATYSPDGTQIAAELDWNPASAGGSYFDGIAIMNADGSNPVPLTGNDGCNGTMPLGGWDEMPSFTHDGKIMFSRHCSSDPPSTASESMYVIDADGTNLTQLYTGPTPGLWNYNPVLVGDRLLFQTNQDNLQAYLFEIYSMKSDGTEVIKLTNNSVYDGFDTSWYAAPTPSGLRYALHGVAATALHSAAWRVQKANILRQCSK
ncbi:MAG TPA: DPP IV N-terminal domain-containing protein [Candidatus Sulfotelmatobacter sp.]|nr:DPP IV N-terminal domain-containing protein [Candidatus Sulfotelmatobacter sp.]